jgi:peptidoglycan/LPS O-acetylase OafA/YrhL
MNTATPPSVGSPAEGSSIRLEYLDGLRGIAAFFVVAHHVWQMVAVYAGMHALAFPKWFKLFAPLKLGGFGVAVFIVLSGYCLTLPLMKRPGLPISGGVPGFAARRARRILPPYAAALLFSMLVSGLVPVLSAPSGALWDIALPEGRFGWQSIGLHLTLLHNLSESYRWAYNPPLWSVALEWQLYFVFALGLVPLWRRFGIRAFLGAAIGVSALTAFGPLHYVNSWFLALFAFGSGAAWVTHSPEASRARGAKVWSPLGGASALMAAALGMGPWFKGPVGTALSEVAAGVAAACMLIAVAQAHSAGRTHWIAGLCELRPSYLLGQCSYSLYLFHYPILAWIFALLLGSGLSVTTLFFALMVLGVTASLAAAALSYFLLERPFMKRR